MGHPQLGSLVSGLRHSVRALVGVPVLPEAVGSVEVPALAGDGVEGLAGAGVTLPDNGKHSLFYK